VDEGDMLLIPGPVTLTHRVLSTLAQPVRPHYGDEWVELHKRVTRRVAGIFGTGGDVFLLYGPGRAGVEMALGSLLARGDQVLAVGGGFFTDLSADIARALGLEVRRLRPGGHRPVSAEAVAAELAEHHEVRAVVAVHHETDLGLVNPVQHICQAARQRGVLTVVDAVSSLGGVPFDMDGWGVDVCVTVANKCLGGPVGVAPVAVGGRAWEAVDDGRPKAAGWYLNLSTWRWYLGRWGEWHPHPATMPTGAVAALGTALDEILETGLEAHLARQAAAAGRTRAGLRALGFEMLVPDEWASPVTTAVLARPEMDVADYEGWLRERHRLVIGGGLGELSGRLFRVGHMGAAANPEVVEAFLAATADYLREKGL
jgi:alanine-glyoxylate transaminase/serine-glyoxylate transaminase/serine-pyruvate transaminase